MNSVILRVVSLTMATSSIELVELTEMDRSQDFFFGLSLRDLLWGVVDLLLPLYPLELDDRDLDLDEPEDDESDLQGNKDHIIYFVCV